MTERSIYFLFLKIQTPVTESGLILTIYCVVPACSALFAKQNTFFSTKNSKVRCCLGGCSILNALNLKKMRGKNSQLCPFTGLSCPFLVILHAAPIF